MSPTARRRPRKTSRTPRLPGRGGSLPGLDGVFRSAFQLARGVASAGDPLDAELVASTLLAMWEIPLIDVDDPVDFMGQRFVSYLAARRSPDAMALLLGFASVAQAGIAKSAQEAARRLHLTKVIAPAWADGPTESSFDAAWISTDEYGDQDLLVAEFQRNGVASYSVAALIDHALGGIAKSLSVTDDVEQLRTSWTRNSELPVRAVAVQEYADRISHALQRSREYGHRPAERNEPDVGPFLESRLRQLPTPRALPIREVSDAACRRLEREFVRSAHGRSMGSDAHLAGHFISYGADYGSGDPLRWSPAVVELCLLDWFPRKATLGEAEIDRVPDALRAWLRFAGEIKGLSTKAIDASIEAVGGFETEFREAMHDRGRFGPAKSIVSAMLGEGVDLGDQAALDDWLQAFNARPRAERDRVLGHLGLPPGRGESARGR